MTYFVEGTCVASMPPMPDALTRDVPHTIASVSMPPIRPEFLHEREFRAQGVA